jgi:hypothetical protein
MKANYQTGTIKHAHMETAKYAHNKERNIQNLHQSDSFGLNESTMMVSNAHTYHHRHCYP